MEDGSQLITELKKLLYLDQDGPLDGEEFLFYEADLTRIADFVNTKLQKARSDEQYQTLALLKKLGVLDETAMNKLSLEGHWDKAYNLRLVNDEVIRRYGEV